MYNHAPEDYSCPFCVLFRGVENEHVLSVAADIFYHDEDVSAIISSHQWPNNHGHALVIPNQHFENIYDLPAELVSSQKLGVKQDYAPTPSGW